MKMLGGTSSCPSRGQRSSASAATMRQVAASNTGW
jgi:hypothetical protein